MLKLCIAFLISFVVTVVSAPYIIRWLRKMKFGQTILEDGPIWHKSKQGTPVMGGLAFILGSTVATLLVSVGDWINGDFRALLTLLPALAFAAVGASDDLVKVTKKQNKGLTAKQKFALQLLITLLFTVVWAVCGGCQPGVWIPFLHKAWSLPVWLYILLVLLFITGTDNATNLTDGVDGLLSGTALPSVVLLALLAGTGGLAGSTMGTTYGIPLAALAGGLVGFLIFNYHPAKVFMGDTGSLFVGGLLGCSAVVASAPLLLVISGFILYWETLSVILQVGYFKLTHGKRIFKMAPYHHHLEKSGWNEYRIFWTFFAVSVILSLITWFFK